MNRVEDMTYLWSGMILIGIVYGTLTGNLQEVTEAAVASSREAVQLAVAMAGITAMWTGLMKIAEKTGLVEQLSRGLRPVLKILFPKLSPDSKASSYISLNFLANFLGLGWAATPAGLKAMDALAELEEERRSACVGSFEPSEQSCLGRAAEKRNGAVDRETGHDRKLRPKSGWAAMPCGVASNEMCTFLILNISSLQLIPVNVIAYRSQYGSVNSTAIVGPGILATAVSTGVAVVFCKAMDRRRRRV